MGHHNKGHYAAKQKGRQLNKTVAEKIEYMAKEGSITCAAAHKIGKELNLLPSEIGIQIDLMELRIIECQLGLFGHKDGKKTFDLDIAICAELDNQLDKFASDGKISCQDCWSIGTGMKIKRKDIGSACEKKNIKIKPCQLGAF
jgi:hypothetical protein